jgi:glycosidase
MIGAMSYWVHETDIDGFRCDVAARVPVSFWNRARMELGAIKPVFMLAEADDPALHRAAFDMTYNWDLLLMMRAVARGKQSARDLANFLAHPPRPFPPDAYRMNFTSNHDINSWTGTDRELFGDSFEVFATLAALWPGMPLVYGGQEAGLDKRLKFFERDPIEWDGRVREPFYQRLLTLKRQHPALWNGTAGGAATIVDTGNPAVLAFERRQGVDGMQFLANLSPRPQAVDVPPLGPVQLQPWEYRIRFPSPPTAAAANTH